MALKFNCAKCGSPIVVKFLKPGEKAWCKICGAESVIPETAINVEEEPRAEAEIRQPMQIIKSPEAVPQSPLLPLSKLLSMTIDIFADNKRIFIILGTISFLLSILSDIIDLPMFSIPEYSISLLIAFIITALILVSQIPIVLASSDPSNSTNIRSYYIRAIPLFLPYLITSIFLILIILFSAVCLIIPAIITFVWFNFSVYFVVIEHKYYFKALSASKALVKHRWWPVFGRILLPNLVIMSFIIISAIVTSTVGKTGSISFSLLYIIVSNTIRTFGMVLLIIFEVLLFKDLKSRGPA